MMYIISGHVVESCSVYNLISTGVLVLVECEYLVSGAVKVRSNCDVCIRKGIRLTMF